jgi:tetratricopeptide (TPR) repeat protein
MLKITDMTSSHRPADGVSRATDATGHGPLATDHAYTLIVTRWYLSPLLAALLSAGLFAQKAEPPKPVQEPAEEDESYKTKEYSFNPLQAQKEVQVGNFYFKKKDYKAAAGRFLEATRWNKNLAEAYLRLGDAEEKLKNPKAAQEAYAMYLQLDPNSKEAPAIKKKLAKK